MPPIKECSACHAEIFADGYLPVHHTRFLCNVAQRNHEGMFGHGDSPAAAFPEHAHGCDSHRAVEALLHLWRAVAHPPEDRPDASKDLSWLR